jgi:hypothetical protein
MSSNKKQKQARRENNRAHELMIVNQKSTADENKPAIPSPSDHGNGQNGPDWDAILTQSALNFKEMQYALEKSGIDMRKLHRFNERILDAGDHLDLNPAEMLCALELAAKYIILYQDWSGGVKPLTLLGFNVDELAKGNITRSSNHPFLKK